MVDSKEVLKNPVFIARCSELVSMVITVSLLQDIGNTSVLAFSKEKKGFILMVTGSYLLIVPMQIIGLFMEQKTPKNLAIGRAMLGALLWSIATWILLESYYNFFPYGSYIDQAANLIPGGKIISSGLTSIMNDLKEQFFSAGVFTALNGVAFLAEAGVTYKWSETERSFLPLFRK